MLLLRTAIAAGFLVALASAVLAAEPTTFRVHESEALRVAFAPGGEYLVTLGKQDSVKLWDIAAQRLVHEFAEAKEPLWSFDFSHDGKKLLTIAWDRKIRIWNADNGRFEQALQVAHSPTDAAFSPDGAQIAVVFQQNNLVHVLDAKTGKSIKELTLPMEKPPAGSKGLAQVSYSPDGSVLVAASGGRGWPDFSGEDSQIGVWDTKDWSLRSSFVADPYNINSLAISPDNQFIAASCHRSKCAKVWLLPTHTKEGAEKPVDEVKPAHVLVDGAFDCQAVAFSPDSKLLAVTGGHPAAKRIVLYRMGPLPTDKPTPIYLPRAKGAWDVAFDAKGERVAAVSVDGTVTLWDLNDLPRP